MPVSRVPDLLATLFAAVGWLCVALALVPLLRDRSAPVRVAAEYLAVPIRPNLAYAAFLGLLAASLRRRTRMSWWVVVLFYFGPSFVGSLVAGFTEPPLFVSATILSALLAVVLAARRQFTARLEKGNGARAVATLVAGLLVASTLGSLLVWAFPGSLGPVGDRIAWAVDHVLGGLGAVRSLDVVGHPPAVVTFLCGLLGAVAFLVAAWVLFRPTRSHATLSPEQEARVRGLLATAGERDSLGYFATRRDKAAIFSPSGKAAVTYRVVFGTSLASGDPIGDPEAWPPAIAAWLAEARGYAWTPAVIGVSEQGARAYQRAGLSALQIGDEAVVETAEFALDGRAMAGVRQAVRRIEKSGHTCRIRHFDQLTPQETADVRGRANAWRGAENERGFSMALGRLGDPADGRCVLVEALGPGGQPRAVLSFVPWGQRGLSLDLMRRDRESDNGLVEYMVVSLIKAGRQLGIDRISLNFAAFREVFEQGARIGAGPFIRSARTALLFLGRWWQLESLYRSNAKYRPAWEPRLLCFRTPRDLPRISVGLGIAEGLVPVPSLGSLFGRGRGRPGLAIEPGRPDLAPALGGTPAPAPAAAAGPADPYADLPEQMRVRRRKLDRLRAKGIDPYPVGCARTTSAARLRSAYPDLPPDTRTGDRADVTGRVLLNRGGGRLQFATIQEGTGRIQVMLSEDRTGVQALARWRHDVDLGDHVGVRGEVVTTRRGELTVFADEWRLTAKCLRPLPDKHHGLHDPEERARMRHIDLITNPMARDMLHLRSRVVAAVREYLAGRGFVEVETPMLQRVPGGANARPLVTYVTAHDMRLYLRIAPELFLKRLIIGGEERVFELGRSFRNEAADAAHNPEFTMLEAYQAYADYDTMLVLAREMIQHAAVCAFGAMVARRAEAGGAAREVDLGGEWRVRTVNEAVSEALGEAIDNDTTVEALTKLCNAANIGYAPWWSRGAILLQLYEHLCEARTVEPTFYRDFPSDVSPLARQHRADSRMSERWDLVAFGTQVGTAYSEQIDPVRQRESLAEQSVLAAKGDPEAMELDEDFLSALEYAMPPTGGLGIGVDRLMMMLTGRTIRETILFPVVRPYG